MTMQAAETLGLTQYYDRLTPGRALAASYLLWLSVFVIAPVDPRWSDVATGYMLILLGLGGLSIGFMLPDGMSFKPARVTFSNRVCQNAVLVCAFLGMIGLGLKLYDIFVLRGVSLDQDVISARTTSSQVSASGISILAAAFLPFANAALMVAWYAWRVGYIRRIGFWPLVAALAPIGVPLLFGSRSGLIFFITLLIAAYLNLVPKLRARILVFAVLGGAFLATLFALIFINRVDKSGINLLYAARVSAYTQVVPLQTWALNYIDSGGDLGPLLAGYASIMQYIVSGMFEFLYLVELKDDNFAWGSNTFFFLPKLAAIITNSGSVAAGQADLDALNPRAGVFQTFFGAIYIDFGLFLPLFCVALGFFVGMLRQFVRSGNVFAFPLYALFLSQFLLAASFDSLTGNAAILSNAMYLLLYIGGNGFRRMAGD